MTLLLLLLLRSTPVATAAAVRPVLFRPRVGNHRRTALELGASDVVIEISVDPAPPPGFEWADTASSPSTDSWPLDDESAGAIILASMPSVPPPLGNADPLLNTQILWEMIEPHAEHLCDEDQGHLRAVIDVLLAKV